MFNRDLFACLATLNVPAKLLGLLLIGTCTAYTSSTLALEAAAQHPGEIIYNQSCAACHDNPSVSKAPGKDALESMRLASISYAINDGKMKAQASHLSSDQKLQLMDYLVGSETVDESWIDSMMCSSDRKNTHLSESPTVANFGFNAENHRYISSTKAGITTSDFSNLEVAWVLAFPKATTMRSQAALSENTLFLPVAEAAKVFAIDVSESTPCFKWVYSAAIPLRSSAAMGQLSDGRHVVAVADQGANVHLIDASNGKKIWVQHVAISEYSMTTGTPIIDNDRVYAPLSQYEITQGARPDHTCCTSHGGLTALEGKTGEIIWTAHTMPAAKPVRDRGDGQMIWGPSGAPIWNSPAIDTKRGVIYVGTGEATSEPAHENTDAILAIDMKDGSIKWSFQATANDIFLNGCGYGSKSLNCPRKEDTISKDFDFGASVVIATLPSGKEVLFAGQKSGAVWALDPDKQGEVLWQTNLGEGSPLGGIHWGLAYHGDTVYAPINRPFGFRPGPNVDKSFKPGMYALNADDGKIQWKFEAEPDCSGDRKQRMRGCQFNIGLSGAPTLIGDVVVSGGLDGFLRAFDAKTGKVLFQFDTAQQFDAINGIEGNGGSIDNASIIAGNGYLFVNSGYGMFGEVPGNVMIAFKAKKTQ
ncbi:hypothetical protein NBRC116494_33800 [Aurantivibrio plasticivorans]